MRLAWLAVFLVTMPAAQAATIAVSPDRLDFQEPDTLERQLIIYNADAAPVSYRIESGAGWLSASEAGGIIMPKQRKAVTIKANPGLAGKQAVNSEVRVILAPSQTSDVAVEIGAVVTAVLSRAEPRLSLLTGLAITLSVVAAGTMAYLAAAWSGLLGA
ncbi:hypothetical protein HYY74_06295 [Candidatus Woesearchaeota archaeon]|nr:hypothetical protein [Candidatus Woesearchaeota archaeon]